MSLCIESGATVTLIANILNFYNKCIKCYGRYF